MESFLENEYKGFEVLLLHSKYLLQNRTKLPCDALLTISNYIVCNKNIIACFTSQSSFSFHEVCFA